MEFFNDEEVETVAWSMHFGDKKFHSELLMRNQTIVMEHLLQGLVRDRLKSLPKQLLGMVERMNPGVIGTEKNYRPFPGDDSGFRDVYHSWDGYALCSVDYRAT